MPKKKFSETLRVAVLIVTLVLVATPGLARGGSEASKYESLHEFKGGADGTSPISSLLLDQAGNLYGTTIGGGAHGDYGTAFELAPKGDGNWTKRVLHSFNNDGKDGFQPSGLTLDSAGNLYGTTAWGGDNNLGTVFKLTPNKDGSWTESVLHSFNNDGQDGNGPDSYGSPIFDMQGNLYGTTFQGGDSGHGTVFEMTPNGDGTWTESVLYSFKSDGKDGFPPFSHLIFDSSGNLYGTTSSGGGGKFGVVFQLTPNGGNWTEKVLHSFSGPDGSHPWGGMILDSAGSLFGTTYDGGPYNTGTVFQLTPKGKESWTESVIYSFKLNGKDGVGPVGGVIFDSEGNLYGTTTSGSPYNDGTVFTLKPGSHGRLKETLLHTFRGRPGQYPTASLVFDRQGAFYGTTEGSQNPHGSAFEIIP
jgi:uncharacterized repeat protein (TIGR03803 family)